MKTKDVIALWILVLWVSVSFSKPSCALLDDLHMNRPTETILWDAIVALFVVVCGLFLISRFVYMRKELERYETEERTRLDELESRIDDH